MSYDEKPRILTVFGNLSYTARKGCLVTDIEGLSVSIIKKKIMSRTPKIKRLWKKQEKRIVRLLYRKGLLPVAVSQLYWEAYKENGKKYRDEGSPLKWHVRLDEIYYCTWSYGEVDEHPLVDEVIERLTSEGIPDEKYEECGYDYDEMMKYSSFRYKGRKWFIKYLESLPTTKQASVINKTLNRK